MLNIDLISNQHSLLICFLHCKEDKVDEVHSCAKNFSLAYSTEMIHQNCCCLWRRRKLIFPSVPGALLWFLCSATWEWIKHISGWFLCCVKPTEEFACLVFFERTVCAGKLQSSFPHRQLDLDVQTPWAPQLRPRPFLPVPTHWWAWLRPGCSKGCCG